MKHPQGSRGALGLHPQLQTALAHLQGRAAARWALSLQFLIDSSMMRMVTREVSSGHPRLDVEGHCISLYLCPHWWDLDKGLHHTVLKCCGTFSGCCFTQTTSQGLILLAGSFGAVLTGSGSSGPVLSLPQQEGEPGCGWQVRRFQRSGLALQSPWQSCGSCTFQRLCCCQRCWLGLPWGPVGLHSLVLLRGAALEIWIIWVSGTLQRAANGDVTLTHVEAKLPELCDQRKLCGQEGGAAVACEALQVDPGAGRVTLLGSRGGLTLAP